MIVHNYMYVLIHVQIEITHSVHVIGAGLVGGAGMELGVQQVLSWFCMINCT